MLRIKNITKVVRMFSGSMVALITPFTSENTIDFETVATLVEWHISSGTTAIVVAGTTGESPTLSIEEKIALSRFVVEQSKGRIKVIAGNGSNCTRSACFLTEQLNDTGIDGFLTVTPYYNKPTNEGLVAHFTAISQASQLPIILYNVPSRTACDMPNQVVQKLSELSNIVGIKDATGDLQRVEQLKELCGQSFALLSGDDETGVAYCLLGGDGVISVTANVVPKQMAEIQSLINAGRNEQAKVLDERLLALHKNLFVEANPIAVKWAMYVLKAIPHPGLRLPLTNISAPAQRIIEQTIEKLQLNPQES